MASNLNVTGNEAQFNERVTFLKEVNINGTLTVPDIKSFADLSITGDNITVSGPTEFLDIVTFNQDLSFPILEIRDRLNVGIGGTVITADSRLNPGKVGIGTTQPTELLDVFGKAKILDLELGSLIVTGLSTFIGVTTQRSTLFSKQLSNAGVSTFFNTVNVKTAGGSVIQDASGTLDIRSNILTLTNNADSQNYAVFSNGAGVELLHTNVKKFNTTGVGVSILGDLIVPDVGIRTSRVGLGTLIPADPTSILNLNDTGNGPLRLDINGGALAVRNIYDSFGSTGINGYYLKRDGQGIRWVSVPPGAAEEGILLQNEGVEVPVGLAQTFTTLNFVQENSLGLGTDTLVATAQNPNNPTGLATIFTNDLWGYRGTGDNADIYRMTNVGINNNTPLKTFHVNSGNNYSVVITGIGSVGIGTTNPTHGLEAHKGTLIDANLRVTGLSTFVGITTQESTLFTNQLSSVGISTFYNTTDSPQGEPTQGAVQIKGGLGVVKNLNVGLKLEVDDDTELNQKLNVDGEATFQDNVIINANNKFFKIQTESSVDKFTVDTDNGDTVIRGTLDVFGVATFDEDVNFTGANYNLSWDKNQDSLEFADNAKATFGDGRDLQLYHNGTSSYIDNNTGAFYIRNNVDNDDGGNIIIEAKSGKASAVFQDDEGVRLYYNDVEKVATTEHGIDVTGHTETDTLKVSGLSTFVGISTQESTLFTRQISNAGVSTFIGITTQKSTLFTNQSSAVGVATFQNTIDVDSNIKDQNDDTGTSVAASLSTNISNATYNSTTGVMVLTITNHGFENGDSILIPDESITFSCTYKGSSINQKYPRSKDPNSGRWLVISNKTTNTFEVNVSDGGLSAGVEHAFVSATGGVIHSSGQYVKNDYRLASVGTGVSWRPSGVQTKRTIWVSKSGSDSNSGLLEGDSKATIGAAAAIAVETDTIKIRPGVYEENNPIGLRTDVSITGEDLRLCIIKPKNKNKDVFHVRRGCLIENLNFGGSNVGVGYDGSACVAFPPPAGSDSAVSGFTAPGPANEGPSGRWRSPYVRNCTNFMTSSIGMKIDGNNADGAFTGINSVGADLKSMVCDSFTQYNENGIGVSLTNNGYAQLVSIFTINTDIAIYASTGAQCDLTNSNSSFGNFGLVAVGLGSTQFTGIVSNTNPAGDVVASTTADQQDTVVAVGVTDIDNFVRRPFDGQALYFKIDLNNYPESPNTGRITKPLERLSSIKLRNVDLTGFSPIDPPSVIIVDADDNTIEPKGPQGIIAEATATVSPSGELTEINVVAQGRNYIADQNLVVEIEGDRTLADPIMEPIYFTVESATVPTDSPAGITTITFNEFIPYELFPDDPFSLQRISRILTSSHSFEYVGTGTDINIATPLQGAIPIKANEVVAKDGAQIPFTSTDQKGNFDIGQGLQINQTTSTISGRDFSRSLQAEVTPLILALR
tara:strand:+ start:4850 stop:9154 length:4305 start_codon:yes stop_codon:yes gene_type:complete